MVCFFFGGGGEGICSNHSWDDIPFFGLLGAPGDEDRDTVPALATATTAGRLTVTAETVQLNAGEEAGWFWGGGWN